jgi:uncharacterized protein involved in exopolysaccharide biosynthesis/Mrp family chromosome partitioning ATPase
VRDLLGPDPRPSGPPAAAPAEAAAAAPALPQVVVEAGGEKEADGPQLPFDPGILLAGVWRRRFLAAGIALLVTLLSIPVALAIRKKQWQAWVTILRKREQVEFLIATTNPAVKLQIYPMATVLRLVKVQENLRAVIEELKLKTDPIELSRQVLVENPKDTDIVEILVNWGDRDQAVRIANALARHFVASADRLERLEAIQAVDSLGAQLASVRSRRAALEAELVEFQGAHGVVKLSEQAGHLLQQVTEFDSLAEKERLDADMAATGTKLTREALAKQQGTVVASIFVKKPLQAHLVDLQTKLADALSVYTEENSKVKELRDEIGRVEALVKLGLEEQLQEQTVSRNPVVGTLEQQLVDRATEAATRDARAKGYAAVRDSLKARLVELPEVESRLVTLQQGLETLRQLEKALEQRVEEARIVRDSTASNFSIMQEAQPPKTPLPSKSKLVVLAGLFLGSFAGVATAAALELKDTSLKALREVETALKAKPLGDVPFLPAEHVLLASALRVPEPVLETYRHLVATLLLQPHPEGRCWVLLVASGSRYEGRTSLALNLGRIASSRGLRTCVVDTDLRKPNLWPLGPLLGLVPDAPGLEAVLRGEVGAVAAAQRPDTDGPSLLAVEPGTNLKPEALASPAFREAVAALRGAFDLVLLDSSPVLDGSDALLLAPAADGVLYVVESGGLPRAAHRKALESLASTGAPLVGVVLNKVPSAYLQPFSVHARVRDAQEGAHAS